MCVCAGNSNQVDIMVPVVVVVILAFVVIVAIVAIVANKKCSQCRYGIRYICVT